MRERPALFLGLLADQPELIAEVGVLRWRAAGSVGTPGPWIQSAARTAGRDTLPLTLVAMGLEGEVIAAVTLDVALDGGPDIGPDVGPDVADGPPVDSCAARAPWVVRMVVRPGERLCGVGRLMVAAVEDLARQHGHDQLWVMASDPAAELYRHCGWDEGDSAELPASVLRKALAGA